MRVIYIKATEKPKSFLKRIRYCFDYYFNIIRTITIQSDRIYCLPILYNKKIKKKKIKRLSYKIIKKLEKDESNIIVLSEYLSNVDYLKIFLCSKGINILDGRLLFKCLYNKIISYILDITNERIEDSQIWITINDYTELNKEIIMDIARKVKTLNIVTTNINKFRSIEKTLYNEYGILLNISNSKKTSLVKSRIILNFDFPEEIINRYVINRNAIVVNFLNKVQIYSKKFNGININYYNISMPKEYILEGFSNQIVYESKICNFSLDKTIKMFYKDDINIKYLIGNKGKINEHEYKKQ